ncbi:MAG: hypothetical protein ABFD46_08525 [Armatimonadota bacterium]
MEKLSYNGWPNCIRMSSGSVELIITTDVGPRIIRYGFVGQENELYEFSDQAGKTGGNEFRLYGGHRLWLAPERKDLTYFPDNSTVDYETDSNTLRLIPGIESTTGIQKELLITLDQNDSSVKIVHKVTNRSSHSIELAPWALSMMTPGGFGIIPQEPYSPHPDIPDYPGQVIDPKYYLPVRTMVLWSYTDLSDHRLRFMPKYITLRQDKNTALAIKLGLSNSLRWAAYARNRHLFIKTFSYDPKVAYPDNGCNFEIFTDSKFMEIESLGPLRALPAGQSIIHEETWSLFDHVDVDPTEESIDANVLPKVFANL